VVKYHKRQADHPEFSTTFESIGQTVEVDISYLDLMVVRKTILTSYDFILKTFTNEKTSVDLPNQPTSANAAAAASGDLANSAIAEQGEVSTAVGESVNSLIQEALDTIRVDVRFKGTDFGFCHDDGSPIALLSVTAANMRVMVTQQTIVEAKIGSITLSDQLDLVPTQNPAGNYQFQQQRKVQQSIDPSRLLLYVRGDELADFKYETFDPKAANYPGHNAAITLRVGAAHMAFVERPIRELMLFGSRFSAMHELFEAARQAAAYGTTQLTEEMMGGGQKIRFDISMSAPVITFPRDGFMPYSSLADEPTPGVDMLVAQPGELVISNEFTTVREIGKDWDVNHISLSLRHMGIKTVFVVDSDASDNGTFGQPGEQVLQILEDVDYNMDMHILVQGHISGCPRPVTELIGTLSPVKMKLTEYQYKMVYDLLGVIGR
ncbi:Vacuolar protein sorting-associated protein 13, partial [Dipsacomyces acuminosporus]